MRWSIVLSSALALGLSADAAAQRGAPGAGGRSGAGPTLALGGDVLYDAPLAYQLRRRARDVGREEAYREVFRDLAPALSGADLALVNLEVPISRRYRERSATEDVPVFRAPEDFLDALVAAGVDAVTVANNHAYDQGTRGLRNTLQATTARGVRAVGVGDDAAAAGRAVIVETAGARIAIAAWTEGSNHRPRADEGTRPRIAFVRDGTIGPSLERARREADLVIAVFHWTQEDLTRPRPVMREVAMAAAEAGADLVIGHGTHLPGATEELTASDGRRVRVLYSLGNLLAAMEEPAGTLTSPEVGVRDAPLAMIRTRWRGRRLEVADIGVRHHWIARPLGHAPWLDDGRLAVSRPVSIRAELARLRRADCGRPCAMRAAAYQRRVGLIDAAMARLDEAPPPLVARADPARSGSAAAGSATSGSATAGSTSSRSARPRRDEALAPARSETPPRRSRRSPAAGRGAVTRRTAARRARSAERGTIADDDPRLAPYLRGVSISVDFPEGGALEESIDDAAIRRLAALLREDRGLRVEVIGYATDEEERERAGLGNRRARRVKGLIAVQGPSRSRFSTRGRRGASRVVVRLRR